MSYVLTRPRRSIGRSVRSPRPLFRSLPGSKKKYSILSLAVCSLILLLAISRYDATSYTFRRTEEIDFLSWFWRARWQDALAFFDFAILILLVIVCLKLLGRKTSQRVRFDRVPLILFVLVTISSVISLLFPGNDDTNRELIFQLRNYFYFGAAYFIASRLAWREHHSDLLVKVFIISTVMLVSISFWERTSGDDFFVSKYGQSVALKDIADYPWLLFCEFWVLALAFSGVLRSFWQRVLAGAAIVYSLFDVFGGTGKLLIILYPMVVLYMGWWYRITKRAWFVLAAPIVLLTIIVGATYFFQTVDIYDPTSSFYVYAALLNPLNDTSSSTRIVELRNFFQNIFYRNAYLQGIGLGSRWYEYTVQPVDAGAYPIFERISGTHLGIHVPLLRLILDFGLIGFVFFSRSMYKCFNEVKGLIRSDRVQESTKAFIHSSWLIIVYIVFFNNLTVPKMNLLGGILLGVLACLVEHERDLRRRKLALLP